MSSRPVAAADTQRRQAEAVRAFHARLRCSLGNAIDAALVMAQEELPAELHPHLPKSQREVLGLASDVLSEWADAEKRESGWVDRVKHK